MRYLYVDFFVLSPPVWRQKKPFRMCLVPILKNSWLQMTYWLSGDTRSLQTHV